MRKSGISIIYTVSLICASFVLARPASALIPVIDAASTTNAINDFMQSVKETKFVTDTVSFVSKTSATIGDAYKSTSEFIKNNKEALEKKLAKVKEYKEKAEAYKKEYDAYKKWAEDNIAEAKKFKSDVEGKIDEVKSYAADAKDVVNSAKELAGSAKDIAASKINNALDKTGTGVSLPAGGSTAAATPQYTAEQGSVTAPQTASASTRRPFVSQNSDTTVSIPTGSSSSLPSWKLTETEVAQLPAIQSRHEAGKTLSPAEQNVLYKNNLSEKISAGMPLSPAEQAYSQVALSSEQQGEIIAAAQKQAAEEELSPSELKLLARKELQDKLAAGGELTPEDEKLVADIAKEQVEEAKEEDKKEEPSEEEQERQEALKSMTDEELQEKFKALDEAKRAGLAENANDYTWEELAAALKSRDEAKLEELIKSSQERALSQEEFNARLKAKDEAKKAALGNKNQAPRRRSFTTQKHSALSGEQPRSFASLQNSRPLAFAALLGGIKDNGTDANGTYIIPKVIAMTCDLTSETARKDGAMDACLVRLNDIAKKAAVGELVPAQKVYLQGKKELAAAYIAEAFKAQQEAEEFSDKVLDAIDLAVAPTELDIFNNVVEMNKAYVTTVNNLLKVYSARNALMAYDNYGVYKFSSPEEETEQ